MHLGSDIRASFPFLVILDSHVEELIHPLGRYKFLIVVMGDKHSPDLLIAPKARTNTLDVYGWRDLDMVVANGSVASL